jgi:vanillate/3-O-methylgallate O-demethylase
MTTANETMRTLLGTYAMEWGRPEYTGWIEECISWKQTCYIGDWDSASRDRHTGRGSWKSGLRRVILLLARGV